jgi:hypothetical protein
MGMGMGMGRVRSALNLSMYQLLVACTISMLFVQTSVQAQAPEDQIERVRSWLEKELHKGFSLDEIAPAHLVLWTGGSVLDDAELRRHFRRLHVRVSGHPEHSDRVEYERVKKLLMGPGRANMVEFFIGGSGEVRQSNTYGSGSIEYRDSIVTKSVAWSITPTEVTLINPSRGYPKNANFSALPGGIEYICGFLLTGGTHVLSRLNAQITDIQGSGSAFVVRLQLRDGATLARLSLQWNDSAATGWVERIELTEAQTGAFLGLWLIEGWDFNESLQRYTARRWVEQRDLETMPVEWSADVIERAPQAEISRVLQPPTANQPDPIRGTVLALVDYRHDPRGIAEALAPSAPVVEGRLPIGNGFRKARWLAGGSAVVFVMTLILLKYRPNGSSVGK